MQFKIQVVAVGPDGHEVVREIISVERDTLQPETLGLSLAEGKAILSGIQTVVVEQQASAQLKAALPVRSVGSPSGAKASITCRFGPSLAPCSFPVRACTSARAPHSPSGRSVPSRHSCPTGRARSSPSS